jgi:hypothetical protein
MLYIVAAIAVGVVAYVAVVIGQSREHRTDIDKWRDMFGVAAVASLVLVGYVMWSAFGRGPGASLRSVLEAPFEYRANRWILYVAGYSAAAFALFAGLHVGLLRFRLAAAARHDA